MRYIPCMLENAVQNYQWGQSGRNAYIPDLIGEIPEMDQTYAEIWIGAHPKAPSKVITKEGK
ncbi:mannose-6-phosphate isomerase, class I, partial [bacterium]|nr:mannose-6-phosphate isomerase, class I [bacterium]